MERLISGYRVSLACQEALSRVLLDSHASEERIVTIELAPLGAVSLLVLCIYTLRACARDSVGHLESQRSFLFAGVSERHSLASMVGSLFSVTYFIGATLAYAKVFRVLSLAVAGVAFMLLMLLLPRIISNSTLSDSPAPSRSHPSPAGVDRQTPSRPGVVGGVAP